MTPLSSREVAMRRSPTPFPRLFPGFLLGLLLAPGCQGDPGAKGEPGADGSDGAPGQDGQDGTDGQDGQDGQDGTDGQDGQDGTDGQDGQDGQDGHSIGVLTGTVYGADGSILVGAEITTVPTTYISTTDQNGQYLFPAMPSGTWDVTASAEGWSDTTVSVDVVYDGISIADIVLDPIVGDIPVMVADAEGNPLDAVTLSLRVWDFGTNGWADVASTLTDATGAATFTSLADGLYVVYAAYPTTDDYLPTENRWSAHPGEAVSLVMNENHYDANHQGAYYCVLCHDGGIAPDATGWKGSLHAVGLRAPGTVSSNQDLSAWPDADAALAWFIDGNAHDNTGADSYGYRLDLDTYHAWLGHDGTGYYARFSNDAAGTRMSERYDVAMTYGGEGVYAMRFAVRLRESDWANATAAGAGVSWYLLPVQFNDLAAGTTEDPAFVGVDTNLWQAPGTSGGTAVAAAMTPASSFETACAGCHFTGLTVSGSSTAGYDASGTDDRASPIDFDGDVQKDETNVGCEACHGPGGAHGVSPKAIMNPAHLTPAAETELCGRCHSRGTSTEVDGAGHAHAFPYDSAAGGSPNAGVDALDAFQDAAPEQWTDASGAPVDHSKGNYQQYSDFQRSAHANNPYERLTCTTCHDVHQGGPGKQITQTLTLRQEGVEVVLEGVSAADNSLCLGCHAGYGPFSGITFADVEGLITTGDDAIINEVVTEHMDYQVGMGGVSWYDPAGTGVGNCVGCHMPPTARSGRWETDEDGALLAGDIHDHTFVPVMPDETAATVAAGYEENIPNSCGSCHEGFRYAP